MASSFTKSDLPRVGELGIYSEEPGSRYEDGRPHETSRVLAADELDFIGCCAECGKRMDKDKSRFVCSCKWAIHCSKACFKSSSHKCQKSLKRELDKTTEIFKACEERYQADVQANRTPSSDKIQQFLKMTRGDQKRIMKYAESNNPTAAFLIGIAYAIREFERPVNHSITIPLIYKEKSCFETDKVAVKWLKVAAEAGFPEAMYQLFVILIRGDKSREADYWLAKAHATGQMEYLAQLLEAPNGLNFPAEFRGINDEIIQAKTDEIRLYNSGLASFLMATRFWELKMSGGKTAMGEPFYGWREFNKLMESIGEFKNDESKPSIVVGEKKTLAIVITRRCLSLLKPEDLKIAEREENNIKFKQGVKDPASSDYQLVDQTSRLDGKTNYFVDCKHISIDRERQAGTSEWVEDVTVWRTQQIIRQDISFEYLSSNYRIAGKCESCVQEAKQRLRAASLGQFSISMTPVFQHSYYYATRYANDKGVIVQDVFGGYSKSYMRQTLQCLMSNPVDLHPLAVAEHAILFWPIIWFWGSVYRAIQDCCDKATLDAIYHGLGVVSASTSDNTSAVAASTSDNTSAVVAFPETAAGEWRNGDCVRVDHEFKFNLCEGCKVRRYCDPACQRQDWPRHQHFCKAGKKEEKGSISKQK